VTFWAAALPGGLFVPSSQTEAPLPVAERCRSLLVKLRCFQQGKALETNDLTSDLAKYLK